MKIKKSYKTLKIIFNIKFIWTKPKHSDILIYTANMVEFISPHITKYKSDIIHTRLEKIYEKVIQCKSIAIGSFFKYKIGKYLTFLILNKV